MNEFDVDLYLPSEPARITKITNYPTTSGLYSEIPEPEDDD